jgi:hypothetical protein
MNFLKIAGASPSSGIHGSTKPLTVDKSKLPLMKQSQMNINWSLIFETWLKIFTLLKNLFYNSGKHFLGEKLSPNF